MPGSDGYLPSIFTYSKNSEPRPTRTSVAAGYISLPKTWHHIRHHLSRATKRQLTCTLGPPASSGRPPKQPRFDICVAQSLKQCGHDYLQTTCEDMPSLPVDLLRDLASIEKLRNENELLKLRMLTLSNVKCNDKLFQFYTNIPNFHVFDAVREYLQSRLTDGSNTMRRWRGAKQSCNQFSETREMNKPQISGYSDKLSFEEELFLVLVKLKTGRMNQDLAFHFDISVGLVSELFTSWLYFLSVELKALFEVVECGPVADGVPSVYRNMSDLRIVLDCTELMLQKPSDLQERKETFSNYKHHETVKFLVGMSPQLYINYISKAYGGRASDKHITLQSNSLLQSLPPGAQVMADRGFTVSQDLRKLGVRTIIPAFKGRGRPRQLQNVLSQMLPRREYTLKELFKELEHFISWEVLCD